MSVVINLMDELNFYLQELKPFFHFAELCTFEP